MIERTEIELSTFEIKKAETRLNKQRAVVSNLHFDTDPRLSSLADDILGLMQERIVVLQTKHRKLLIDADRKVVRLPPRSS